MNNLAWNCALAALSVCISVVNFTDAAGHGWDARGFLGRAFGTLGAYGAIYFIVKAVRS